MKLHRLILPAIVFLFSTKADAQWVTISSGFAQFISQYVSAAAINGTLLDTSNTVIDSATVNMTIADGSGISDITGIQYFKALQNVVMYNGVITDLPQLPPVMQSIEIHAPVQTFSTAFPGTLQAIKFYNSSFTSMPALPAGLQKLIIASDGNITSIPTLPATLQELIVGYCTGVSNLPALPQTLNYLDVSGSSALSTLPALDNSLQTIIIDYTSISSLPTLPDTLKHLSMVRDLAMSSLPALPQDMWFLDIDSTQLSSFPLLPTHLEYLYSMYCPYKFDTVTMPPGLIYFYCSYCPNTTALPAFSLGVSIYADHCNIMSTALLPMSVGALVISNNPLDTLTLPYELGLTLTFDNMPNLTTINFDSSAGIIFEGEYYGCDTYFGPIGVQASNCPHAGQAIYNLLGNIWHHSGYCSQLGAYVSSIQINCQSDSIPAMPVLACQRALYQPIQ